MAFARGPVVVKNGLVLWLDAANRTSYPGSGTIWRDLSGSSVTGSLTNGPTFSSGNGGSLVFDGVDDYIAFNNVTVNTNTGFTWNFFIYINDPQPIYANFWSYFYSTGNNGFEFGTYATGSFQGRFVFKDSGASGFPSITSPYVGNRWANITIGCSATIPFMYVNGVLVGTTTAFRSTNIVINSLFRRQDSNDTYYKASMSMFQVYNRALPSSEIQQNYNALKGRYGL